MVDATSIHNRKVAIVGTGNVGASIAYALTIRNLAREIVLINRTESIVGVHGVERRFEERWSEFEYERFISSSTNLKSFISNL